MHSHHTCVGSDLRNPKEDGVTYVLPSANLSFLRSSISFQALAEGLLEAGDFICRRITKLFCISETCWRYLLLEQGFVMAASVIGALLLKISELNPCSGQGLPSFWLWCTFRMIRICERWQQSFVATKRSYQKIPCAAFMLLSLADVSVHVTELNARLWICKRGKTISREPGFP